MEFTWQSVYKFRVCQFNKALPSSRIIFYYYLLFTTSFIYLPLGFAIIYIFTVTAWRVSLSRSPTLTLSLGRLFTLIRLLLLLLPWLWLCFFISPCLDLLYAAQILCVLCAFIFFIIMK